MFLRRTRLLELARRVRNRVDSTARARRRLEQAELAELRRTTARVLGSLRTAPGGGKRVLVLGMDTAAGVALETVLRNAFRHAGYEITIIAPAGPLTRKAYRAFGARDVRSLDEFWREMPRRSAAEALRGAATMQDVLGITRGGVQVGKYALSSLMRRTRQGEFDLADAQTRTDLESMLGYSLESGAAAERLLDELRPDAVLLVDRGYSPIGQVFDAALTREVPVYTWNAAHRDSTLMLKRYTRENRDVHPSALSDESWSTVRDMSWSEAHAEDVLGELRECYQSGEWYGEVGTQVGKREIDRPALARRLGLDPGKRTAVVFPHIFWDSTFFWGTDLFPSYRAWFVEVVRAACANRDLNWVIKIHPANVTKDRRDGVRGEHSEVIAIREVFGELPDHIKVLPADTDVSTFSLFQVMDYCLTVRGTVGIEAASLGVPVLTAGTGRYERLGFTIDSATPEEYLERLRALAGVPRLTGDETTLARRYAYALFFARPLWLRTIRMEFDKGAGARLRVRPGPAADAARRVPEEVERIAAWIESRSEDYLEIGGSDRSGRPG